MYNVIVERFFPPAPGGRGYSTERVAGTCETEAEAKIKVASLKNEHSGEYYVFYREVKEVKETKEVDTSVSLRNEFRRKQIELIQQSQKKVTEAIELFTLAAGKDERMRNMMADVAIELHCKIEMIEEQME